MKKHRPPDAPVVEERTITSIHFVWEPPNDLGSAITGYKVFVEHSGNMLFILMICIYIYICIYVYIFIYIYFYIYTYIYIY
jgi:hypothetical protein